MAEGMNSEKNVVDTHVISHEAAFASRDDEEMAALGKKQQLRRNFSFLGILGFSCILMATWEGLLTVFIYGLEDGGPAGLIYGFLFCWLGYFTVVASMAELVSMAPTAGGQYHWTYLLAPLTTRKFLSYITGWQSVVAWQAAVASSGYLGGTILQGLLVLNYPNYGFKRYHGTLLLYALVLIAVLFNTFLAKHLPKIEGAILILHLAGFLVILIPMVHLSPHGSAHLVFAEFLSLKGYKDVGLAFFIGLVTTVFSFVGADGAVHMCEEILSASTIVPQAMMFSISINGVLGFAMTIAICFCLGDITTTLDSPTGFPFLQIFSNATGNLKSATAMAILIEILIIFCHLSIMAAASRMMWAFARDTGLPGSEYLKRVEPNTKLPLYSLALTATITLLLGLINIGSTEAFNAIVSLVVAGFLGSYIIPISLTVFTRLRNPTSLNWGPWSMGRLGVPTNVFALIWTLIAMIFSFWPTVLPVDKESMNYSSLLWGATTMFGVLFYVLHGRKTWTGPVIETSVVKQLRGA